MQSSPVFSFGLNGLLTKPYNSRDLTVLRTATAPVLRVLPPISKNFDIQPIRADLTAINNWVREQDKYKAYEKQQIYSHRAQATDALMREFLMQSLSKENTRRAAIEAEHDMPYSGYLANELQRKTLLAATLPSPSAAVTPQKPPRGPPRTARGSGVGPNSIRAKSQTQVDDSGISAQEALISKGFPSSSLSSIETTPLAASRARGAAGAGKA